MRENAEYLSDKRPRAATFATVFLTAWLTATPCLAGSIEYLSNQSADYIRTFSRNAAIDAPDIATFNPAGTTFLADNIYLSVSNQTLLGEYGITYDGKRFPAAVFVPVLPSVHGVFKVGNLGIFGAFTVPSGGGSLVYEDGLPYLIPLVTFVQDPDGPTPENGTFSGTSVNYGLSVGAAYKLWDIVSVSLGGRVNLHQKTYVGHATYGTVKAELDTAKSALGFTPIVGLAVRPGFGLTFAARYEAQTAMTFKSTTTTRNMKGPEDFKGTALESFIDGAEERRDMPAVLGAGASWSSFGLTVSASLHYYFTEDADSVTDDPGIPNTGGLGAYTKSWDDDYKNGWDLGGAVEYQLNKDLLISAGYVRAELGGGTDTLNDFEQALDSDSVCAGARYAVLDNVLLTLAVSRTFYTDGSNKALVPLAYAKPETYDKRVLDIGLGAQIRF